MPVAVEVERLILWHVSDLIPTWRLCHCVADLDNLCLGATSFTADVPFNAYAVVCMDLFVLLVKYITEDMGDCQNHGPFLGTYYNMAPNI